MKPGKPLHRKTPLNRTRLNAVSRKNSRAGQDAVMREAYRQANPQCELTPWFRRHFREWPITMTQLDIHHLRKPGRVDVWPNMIRVCRSIHSFDDRHPAEMFVVCLWHKWRKGGLDWNLSVLDLCGIGTVSGQLERNRPTIPAFVPLWAELMECV